MNDNPFTIMSNIANIAYVLFPLSNISKPLTLRFKLNTCHGNEARNEDIAGVNYLPV